MFQSMAKRHAHPAHQSQNRLLQETEVYMMSIVLYIFLSKWGISDKTSARRAQVDKGIVGPVKTVTSAQVPFGWQAEGLVHFLYFLFNVTRWMPGAFKGSTGRTEIFFNVNPVFGFFFVWACHVLKFTPENWQIACAFISPFVWVDGWLWVQVFRGLAWIFAAGLLYLSWWFVVNA
jgi:hypothetical protein